jgi:hypothetical protein
MGRGEFWQCCWTWCAGPSLSILHRIAHRHRPSPHHTKSASYIFFPCNHGSYPRRAKAVLPFWPLVQPTDASDTSKTGRHFLVSWQRQVVLRYL